MSSAFAENASIGNPSINQPWDDNPTSTARQNQRESHEEYGLMPSFHTFRKEVKAIVGALVSRMWVKNSDTLCEFSAI